MLLYNVAPVVGHASGCILWFKGNQNNVRGDGCEQTELNGAQVLAE